MQSYVSDSNTFKYKENVYKRAIMSTLAYVEEML